MKPLLTRAALLFATTLALHTGLRAADYIPAVGIETWTLRNMNFDQMVEFCAQHHITNLAVIDKHMDPFGPVEETKRKKAILDKNGLRVYTFGVAKTSKDKEQNRKLFEFAKVIGARVIVVEPGDMAIWDNLEELVKEYDIKLAVHNHGITSTYGNPETVKKLLSARDPRIGVCLDVGHVTGAGFDAAKVFREYNGRVWDIHLKDKKIETADGKEVILDVEIGAGQANYKGLFEELKTAKWNGVLAIETDNNVFATNPDKYVTGAVGFVKSSFP
jgi:L-ribulose-5-phosphate 3-epimerase